MTVPPFTPGMEGDVDGVLWRIERGQKAVGDMTLHLRVPEWRMVRMSAGLLISDFHYQVEDILHPRTQGEQGGEYWLGAVAEACHKNGWAYVAARIARERNGGARPATTRYRPLAPYEGRTDGPEVGQLRTRLMAAMWHPNGKTPDQIVNAVQTVLNTHREATS